MIGTVRVGGRDRTYLLHTPANATGRPLPVVLAFHGGYGTARGMPDFSGFDAVADRHGFLAVYPDGIRRGWNDGRGGAGVVRGRARVDDVAFTAALLDRLQGEVAIDTQRVFACGISNGAMFSHRLGCELSDRIAAIGLVAGAAPFELQSQCRPTHPVSVVILNGTADPLVPFGGGPVGFRGRRGLVLSTFDTAAFWARHDGCNPAPAVRQLPDVDPADGTRVELHSFTGGREGTAVEVYVIHGGGHTWPGGHLYLPQRMIGPVSRDLDAAETLWRFFAEHPRA